MTAFDRPLSNLVSTGHIDKDLDVVCNDHKRSNILTTGRTAHNSIFHWLNYIFGINPLKAGVALI